MGLGQLGRTLGMLGRDGGPSSTTTVQLPITANLFAWWKRSTGQTVSQWTDQSANGNHFTQAVGGAQPTLNGDGTYTFDGVAQFMATGAKTLNQPCTLYIVAEQLSWTVNHCFCDGNTADTGAIIAHGVSPQLSAEAGTFSGVISLALSTYGIIQAVFNGASSVFQIDDVTEVTGNFGAGNPSGLHLGSYGDGATLFGNIRIKEFVVYSAAHDAATRTTMKTGYLNAVRDTA